MRWRVFAPERMNDDTKERPVVRIVHLVILIADAGYWRENNSAS